MSWKGYELPIPAHSKSLRQPAEVRRIPLRAKHGVGYRDIQDACRRRLDLRSTDDFSTLVWKWLREGDRGLQDTLENKRVSDDDLSVLQSYFAHPDGSENSERNSREY